MDLSFNGELMPKLKAILAILRWGSLALRIAIAYFHPGLSPKGRATYLFFAGLEAFLFHRLGDAILEAVLTPLISQVLGQILKFNTESGENFDAWKEVFDQAFQAYYEDQYTKTTPSDSTTPTTPISVYQVKTLV